MSDIKVTISGDGSGAKRAFEEGGEGSKNLAENIATASEKLHLMVEAFEKVGEKIFEFGKESVEAYFKIEKANLQLKRAAGENTDAFIAQATAMSEHLGVSNVTIETMQKMLATYGLAPSEIGKTVQALLDYSAYSGKDAIDVTRALESSVTGGRTAFKELGLEYDHHGEKTKVITGLVESLVKKVGGSAEEESNTLEGTMKKAAQQTEILKQETGKLIAEFIAKTGAVETFSEAIKTLGERLFGASEDSTIGLQKNIDAAKTKLLEMQRVQNSFEGKTPWWGTGSSKTEIDAQIAEVARLEAAWKKMDDARRHGKDPSQPSDEGHVESVAGNKDGEDKRNEERKKEAARKDLEFFKDIHNQKKLEDDHFEELQEESKLKATDKIIRDMQEGQKKEMAEQDKEQEEWVHVFEKDAKMFERFNENVMRQNEKFKADMAKAGADIANALLGTMMDAIEASMDGGDFDVVSAISDLGFSILSTLAGLIPGVGGFVSQAVNMAGKIVHHETAAAFKRSEAAAGKHHDGGWIEPERFHAGGWPGVGSDESMALLQSGERVLSRSEVDRMGGARGVDSMAQGRSSGGMTVNVSALDARSFMEYMGDRGGRSFYNAIRSGHGTLSSVFR